MTDFALVTGGSRNIGRATCERLSADGYEVIQFDIVEPEASSPATFVHVDLSDETATAAALAEITKDRAITRLVNNVGIAQSAPLEKTALADFDRVMQINTRTAVQCAQALLPAMRETGFGRIVNLASRAVTGMPELTAYAASKGAIVAMTRTWAMEFAGAGVTVNAVAPGPIDTDMYRAVNPPGSDGDRRIRGSIPVGRLGQPEDIANVISFFLDARGGFVTGQVLFACGGMSVGGAA